jgi:hypothetical protein
MISLILNWSKRLPFLDKHAPSNGRPWLPRHPPLHHMNPSSYFYCLTFPNCFIPPIFFNIRHRLC